MQKLLKEIITEIKSLNEDCICEVEYDGKYMDFIDVRIFQAMSVVSEMLLNQFLRNRVITANWDNDTYTVHIPSKYEIKFSFSGAYFERIAIEIPENMRDENLDFLKVIECEHEVTGLGD